MLNSANHRLIKANLTRSSLLLMLLMHNATMEELQQQSGMAESTETFESQQPLTPLLACICSFRAALPAKSFSDSWLIFQHTGMREIRDRKRAVLSYARPWGSIPNSEVNAVCRAFFSLSRGNHSKGYELRNFLTFAKALIAGKVFVANHFKPKAGSLDVPGCNSKPDFFEVQSLMSCKCNWQLATRPNQETWHVEGYRSC